MIAPRLFQQAECALHIGADEFLRTENRTVHMAFGGKMHDSYRPSLIENRAHQMAIANISTNKSMLLIRLYGAQVEHVAGVCELVQIHDALTVLVQPL